MSEVLFSEVIVTFIFQLKVKQLMTRTYDNTSIPSVN